MAGVCRGVLGTAAILLVLVVGTACHGLWPWGGDSHGQSPAEEELQARGEMVSYAIDVLLPLSGRAVQLDAVTVQLDGATYVVSDTADFAALNRLTFFEIGDAALQHIDAMGIDPFQLWPLCGVTIPWMMDQVELSMIASEGSADATLTAALTLPESTGHVVEAVKLELATLDDPDIATPGDRIDPAGCLQAEVDERERRGWPALAQ